MVGWGGGNYPQSLTMKLTQHGCKVIVKGQKGRKARCREKKRVGKRNLSTPPPAPSGRSQDWGVPVPVGRLWPVWRWMECWNTELCKLRTYWQHSSSMSWMHQAMLASCPENRIPRPCFPPRVQCPAAAFWTCLPSMGQHVGAAQCQTLLSPGGFSSPAAPLTSFVTLQGTWPLTFTVKGASPRSYLKGWWGFKQVIM